MNIYICNKSHMMLKLLSLCDCPSGAPSIKKWQVLENLKSCHCFLKDFTVSSWEYKWEYQGGKTKKDRMLRGKKEKRLMCSYCFEVAIQDESFQLLLKLPFLLLLRSIMSSYSLEQEAQIISFVDFLHHGIFSQQ